MEKIIKDITVFRQQFEEEKEMLIDRFTENNEIIEKHDVLLFKKEVQNLQYFINVLNTIILNNSK
jgi:hypothetical protein